MGLRAGRGNSVSSEHTETFATGHGEEDFAEGICEVNKEPEMKPQNALRFSLLQDSIKDGLEKKKKRRKMWLEKSARYNFI